MRWRRHSFVTFIIFMLLLFLIPVENTLASIEALEKEVDTVLKKTPQSRFSPEKQRIVQKTSRSIIGKWEGVGKWMNLSGGDKVPSTMTIVKRGTEIEVTFEALINDEMKTVGDKLIKIFKINKTGHHLKMGSARGELYLLKFNKGFTKTNISAKSLRWQGNKDQKASQENRKKTAAWLAKGLETPRGKRLYKACLPFFEKNIFTREKKTTICRCFAGVLGRKRLTVKAISSMKDALDYGIKIGNKRIARAYTITLMGCQDLVENNSF